MQNEKKGMILKGVMATCIGVEGSPKLVFLFIHDDNEHIELKCRWICKCLIWGVETWCCVC